MPLQAEPPSPQMGSMWLCSCPLERPGSLSELDFGMKIHTQSHTRRTGGLLAEINRGALLGPGRSWVSFQPGVLGATGVAASRVKTVRHSSPSGQRCISVLYVGIKAEDGPVRSFFPVYRSRGVKVLGISFFDLNLADSRQVLIWVPQNNPTTSPSTLFGREGKQKGLLPIQGHKYQVIYLCGQLGLGAPGELWDPEELSQSYPIEGLASSVC